MLHSFLEKEPSERSGTDSVSRLSQEAVEQVDDLAQGLHVGPGDVAEPVTLYPLEALVSAAVLLAEQRAQHLVDQVVDVEELQLNGGVVHGVGAAVGDGVAEGGHGGVVSRAAPLAVEVGEAVDEHRRARSSRSTPGTGPPPRASTRRRPSPRSGPTGSPARSWRA